MSLEQLDVALLDCLHSALVLQLHEVGGEEDDVGHQHRGHVVADLGSIQHFILEWLVLVQNTVVCWKCFGSTITALSRTGTEMLRPDSADTGPGDQPLGEAHTFDYG